MKLQELIVAVKENKLPLEQVEAYHDQMSLLFAEMMVEIADLEKSEALFMSMNNEKSVAQRKVEWKATEGGQRLIVLKRYVVATKELLNSLKSRTFRLIH